MEQIIKRGGHLGVKEVKIGMPHRGRLNVLANMMQKPFKAIFKEFLVQKLTQKDFEGDVKYHLGASANREFDGNLVHISLTDNPSHLEAVNPIVLGQVRAKQFFHKDKEEKSYSSFNTWRCCFCRTRCCSRMFCDVRTSQT